MDKSNATNSANIYHCDDHHWQWNYSRKSFEMTTYKVDDRVASFTSHDHRLTDWPNTLLILPWPGSQYGVRPRRSRVASWSNATGELCRCAARNTFYDKSRVLSVSMIEFLSSSLHVFIANVLFPQQIGWVSMSCRQHEHGLLMMIHK